MQEQSPETELVPGLLLVLIKADASLQNIRKSLFYMSQNNQIYAHL